MSRSNPTQKNPATRFFQWRGGEDGGGRVTWYDKEEEQEKEMALPFTFIVLDELNTITGFSEKDHSGFWSNEVRDLSKGVLTVRTKAGIKARGTYANISDGIKSQGAKYAKSVYIAFKDETGELVLGNIKIAGAALTAWIEFQKKFDVMQCAVMITDEPKKGKKGSNTYFIPVFEARQVGEAAENAAKKLDQQLQQYLGSYLTRKPDEEEDDETEVVDDPFTPEATPDKEELEIEDLDAKEEAEAEEAPAEKPAPAKKAAAESKKPASAKQLKDVPF